MASSIHVYLEVGKKRVFASAAEWPGWCRQGRDEKGSIEALAAAGRRYAEVAKAAGVKFQRSDVFDVVERLPGDASTEFGVPGAIAEAERQNLSGKELEQVCALVAASWNVFDSVVATAPAELRKGPRGGGRDRDEIVDHVLDAESAYASRLGIKLRRPPRGDRAKVKAFRDALLDGIRGAEAARARWPARYAARRIAWHVLDHAWEIEDRSER